MDVTLFLQCYFPLHHKVGSVHGELSNDIFQIHSLLLRLKIGLWLHEILIVSPRQVLMIMPFLVINVGKRTVLLLIIVPNILYLV